MSCVGMLSCGHRCGGVAGEERCLPCLHGCSVANSERLRQQADDLCTICLTDTLATAPIIQLTCGHLFHLRCCCRVLESRWPGARMTFRFSRCPICQASMYHPALSSLLRPIRQLQAEIRRKALMRLEYECLHKSEAVSSKGTPFYDDPAGFAIERYAYYLCYKCQKPYYGGQANCAEEQPSDEDPTTLICGACSDLSRSPTCPEHGTEFVEYKCRYCCSVAVFFCFGTTHFCNGCHDDHNRLTRMSNTELPQCPAGPKARQLEGSECPLGVQHPPTGEEFVLGCGLCRNLRTF